MHMINLTRMNTRH